MRALTFAVLPSLLLAVGAASAQPASADDLFRQGTQLFARGEIKVACERFDASYKLDPAPGTLFNLATCHEADGRLWKARAEFLDFVDRATKAGKRDKAAPAIARVNTIESRLPRVRLVFPAQSNVAAVALDDAPLASDSWSKPQPVEAGAHTLLFQAPGMISVTRTVTAGATPDEIAVPVPVLEPVAAPTPAPIVVEPATPVAAPAAHPSSTRTIGYVLGGAGVVALGIGGVFGVHTLSEKSDATTACGGQGTACPTVGQTQAAQKDLDSARSSALVSTVFIGVGVAAVASAVYLIVTGAPRAEAATTAALRVAPSVTPAGAGLSLAGHF